MEQDAVYFSAEISDPVEGLRPGQTNATFQSNISQHCWAQHVACVWPPCCDVLGVVGSSLKMAKFEPTIPNTSQHVATRWPNARNMLRPTMLRYVALACWDRLAGALSGRHGNLKPQLNDGNSSQQPIATLLTQDVQAPAKPNDCNISTQHIATLLDATYCVRLATLLRLATTCCELNIELVRMPWRNIVART